MFGLNEKIGIGGKLFLAFGFMLTLIAAAAIFGWFGFGQVAIKQQDVINRAIPAMAEAQQLAEVSAIMNAMSPVLASTISEQRYIDIQTRIEKQKDRLKILLKDLEHHGFSTETIRLLRKIVEGITDNLNQQSRQVKLRIEVEKKRDIVISKMLTAAREITELSGSLVANSASGTTAVASSLYELLDNPEDKLATFDALDRLIELDIDSMERMFELRLSSAGINALVTQLSKETELPKITLLHENFLSLLKIITRRVNEINDPTRQLLAKDFLSKLELHSSPENKENVFTLQHRRLMFNYALEKLHAQGLEDAASLNNIVGNMIKEGSSIINQSTLNVEQAVDSGRQTLVITAIISLILTTLFLWFYLQKKVVHRLRHLKFAMNALADGNYDVSIEIDGHDELSSMAETIQVFKQNAIIKERLERVQDATEKELRRHKANLEKDIAESTEQLRRTNKKLEQEAREHDKARDIAEKANRAKTDFFATMSHELRTPMSGLLGTVNLLANTDLTHQQKRYTEIVNSAGQGLLEILNDLLQFSQIEGGKLELGHVDFSLPQLLTNMTSLMQASVEKKGIYLIADIDPEVPIYLKGDPGKLRQILLNLIGNAIKFTKQGRIDVIVEQEQQTNTHTHLLFEVKDTGVGIPESNHKNIFEPFTQVNSSISRQYGGIGLGLAICQRFIDAMGGKIKCNSEKGVGTTISFSLPFLLGNEDNMIEPITSPTYERLLSSLNVLLVEDDEVNCMVAQSYLGKMGCNVTVAIDGFQALDRVKKDQYDVILMDISLPGKDGVQTTHEIRKLEGINPDIPIIAMSAHVFKEEVRQYLEAGMDGFLGKPIDPVRMNNVLYQVVFHNDKTVSLPTTKLFIEQETSCRESLMEDVKNIGLDKTCEFVTLFFETSKQTLTELKHYIEKKDNNATSESAHKLKGAASSVGLNRLYKCAMEIENSAGEQVAGIQQPFDQLQLIYDDSCHLLRRVLESINQQQKAS